MRLIYTDLTDEKTKEQVHHLPLAKVSELLSKEEVKDLGILYGALVSREGKKNG